MASGTWGFSLASASPPLVGSALWVNCLLSKEVSGIWGADTA